MSGLKRGGKTDSNWMARGEPGLRDRRGWRGQRGRRRRVMATQARVSSPVLALQHSRLRLPMPMSPAARADVARVHAMGPQADVTLAQAAAQRPSSFCGTRERRSVAALCASGTMPLLGRGGCHQVRLRTRGRRRPIPSSPREPMHSAGLASGALLKRQGSDPQRATPWRPGRPCHAFQLMRVLRHMRTRLHGTGRLFADKACAPVPALGRGRIRSGRGHGSAGPLLALPRPARKEELSAGIPSPRSEPLAAARGLPILHRAGCRGAREGRR